jgi:hypothetical protein
MGALACEITKLGLEEFFLYNVLSGTAAFIRCACEKLKNCVVI